MIRAYLMIIFIIFSSTHLVACQDMEVDEQTKGGYHISALPTEVTERILLLLDPQNLLNFLQTNKTLQVIGTKVYVEKYDSLGFKTPCNLKSPVHYHSLIAGLQSIIWKNIEEPNNSYFSWFVPSWIVSYIFPTKTANLNEEQNIIAKLINAIDENALIPNQKVKVIDFATSILQGSNQGFEQIYNKYSPKHSLSRIQDIYETLFKPYAKSLGSTSYFQGIPSGELCFMDHHYFMVQIPGLLRPGITFLDVEKEIYDYLKDVVTITNKDKKLYLNVIAEKTTLSQDQLHFLELILLERGFGQHFSKLSKEQRLTIIDVIRNPEHIAFNNLAYLYFPALLARGNFDHFYKEPEKVLLALANESPQEIFAQYEYAKIRFKRDKSLKGEIATGALRYGGLGQQCFIVEYQPELDTLFVILNLIQNHFRFLG
jgi:hypothetical protein